MEEPQQLRITGLEGTLEHSLVLEYLKKKKKKLKNVITYFQQNSRRLLAKISWAAFSGPGQKRV